MCKYQKYYILFSRIIQEIYLTTDDRKTKPFYDVSEESFNRFLALLAPGPEEAAEAYFGLRSKLSMLFQMRGFPDPEGPADETLERLVKRVSESGNEILDIRAYALGIAKKILLEHQRSTRKTVSFDSQRLDLQSSPEQSSIEHSDVQRRSEDCFRKCLGTLSPQTKELLLAYYSVGGKPMKTRELLAQELGLSLNALRVKIHRERSSLNSCIRKCLKSSDIK